MSRFLFMAPPLPGHVNAALAVAATLADRGHDVAWVGSEAYLRPLVGPQTTVYPTGTRLYRPQADRGLVAIGPCGKSSCCRSPASSCPRWRGRSTTSDPTSSRSTSTPLRARWSQPGVIWSGPASPHRPWNSPVHCGCCPLWSHGSAARLGRGLGPAGEPGRPRSTCGSRPHLVVGFTSPLLTGAAELPPNCVLVGLAVHRRLDTPTSTGAGWIRPGARCWCRWARCPTKSPATSSDA